MATTRSLAPFLRGPADWLLAMGRSYDRSLRITSARRSYGEQARLYAKFRKGLSSFNVAPPGRSMHEKGRAFDMARPGVNPYLDGLLAALGAVWKSVGGQWWSSDPVHFQA